jgi:hypothetical protein
MLDILGEKNQLREIYMYGVEDFNNEQSFASLLRFLKRSTKLVKFRVPGAVFTDEKYLQLLDVLKDHELLLRTDLGGNPTTDICNLGDF